MRAFSMLIFAAFLFAFSPVAKVNAGWETTENGERMYSAEDGKYLTGIVTIDSAKYYFDKNGIMQTGKQTYNGKMYYFSRSEGSTYGQMQYGWITDASSKKYAGKSNRYYARKSTGALYVSKWYSGKYYFDSDGVMARSKWIKNKWVNSSGKYTGKTKTGFITWEGNTYYYSSASKYKTGWFKVSGKSYYANSKGVVQKSKWIGNKYVNSSGVMLKSTKKTINGNTYIFKSTGNKYTSKWVKYNKKYYYVNSSGVVQKSKWVGSRYVNSSGVRVTGWKTISGKRYYFSSSGKKTTGYKTISKKRYYFDSSGALVKNGWISDKYYAGSDGAFLTGKQKIDGEYYYFSTSTWKKKTNYFKTVGSAKYYFKPNSGQAARSERVKISGKYYYFGSDCKMVKNTWIDQYYYGSSGAQTKSRSTGWTSEGSLTYYLDSKYNKVSGWLTKDGDWYYCNPNMLTGLQTLNNPAKLVPAEGNGKYEYYFYSDGSLAMDTEITVGATTYRIDEYGVIRSKSGINISGSGKGAEIARKALEYVGYPYTYGGSSPSTGFDCSGFTYYIFKQYFGITLKRTADEQMKDSKGKTIIADPAYLQPGDLIFYGTGNYASHVGIYIGDGKIVHASNSQAYPAGGVKISDYNYSTPLKAVRYWS